MPKKWRKKRGPAAAEGAQLGNVERTSAKLDHIIVSSSGNAPKRTLPHKRVLLGAGLVVVLAAGGFTAWKMTRPEPKPTYVVTEEGVVLKRLEGEALQKEIDKLVFQKKFTSAAQLIAHQDKAKTKDLRMTLAAVYINQNQPQKALEVLLDMEKAYGEDWRVTKIIGQQYQASGDTGQALTYYKKTLQLVKAAAEVPLRADEIHYLETLIRANGGEV